MQKKRNEKKAWERKEAQRNGTERKEEKKGDSTQYTWYSNTLYEEILGVRETGDGRDGRDGRVPREGGQRETI